MALIGIFNLFLNHSEKKKDQSRITMHRVIHFEIIADDSEKVIHFYSSVFGWHIQKKSLGKEEYFLIHTGPQNEKGINGGLKKRKKGGTSQSMITTIGVPDIDAFLKSVKKAGGKVVEKPRVLPNTGYLAYCEDPEGNLFALLQYDSDAK